MKKFINRIKLFGFIFFVFQLFFTASTPAADIPLDEGWNLIGLPVNPSIPYTASSLLSAINSQGGVAQEIDRWYISGWDSHIYGAPFNDFPIEPDKGYFIKCGTVSTWTVAGDTLNISSIPLNMGWNLISLPSSTYQAQSLIDAINSQNGEAQEVDRWYNAGWDSHLNGLPFNNFDLEIDQGYFVRCNAAIDFSLGSETIPPPTGVAATAGDGVVNLSWDENPVPNLAGYNVYRSETSGGPYVKINSILITANSYHDTAVTNGTAYYYVVTAEDTSAVESVYSNEVSATPQPAGSGESEPNDYFTSADDLSLNIPIQATINPSEDIDYFKINLNSAGIFTVSLTNVPVQINGNIQIYDANYMWVNAEVTGGGDGQNITITAEIAAAGNYYLLVQNMNWDSSTSPYTLQASLETANDLYEPNDNFLEAANIGLNTIISPVFFPMNDQDWFKFDITSSGMVTISISNVPSAVNANIQLYNSTQNWIESTITGGGQGQNITLSAEISQTGTYYILLQNMIDIGSSTSPYNLIVNMANVSDAYEPNDIFDLATAVNLDTIIHPAFFPMSDQDWFKLNIDHAGLLKIDVYDVPAGVIPGFALFYETINSCIPYSLAGSGQPGQPVTLTAEIIETGDYYVLVCDMMGKSSASPYSFKAKIVDLWIKEFSHDFNAFSPNADGIKDFVTITVQLSKAASWTINIKNFSQEIVRTFTGIHTITNQVWDGKDQYTAVVPDGTYTYTIDAHDPVSGNDAEQVSAEINVDNTAPTAVISSPANGETVGGTVTIKGTVDDANFGWNNYLYYREGVSPLYWQWIENFWQPVTNNTFAEWNTTVLSNGSYILRLDITDEVGNNTFTDVPIEIYNLIINNPRSYPNPFSPNSDGFLDTTTIYADLTGSADWGIAIKDSLGNNVKTFTSSGSNISRIWNGKNESETIVADDTYTYTITAHDPGTDLDAVPVSGTVSIDNTPPIAVITDPAANQKLQGVVDIIGTVDDPNFGWESYLLYGEGTSPVEWTTISELYGQTINDTLFAWDTTNMLNGDYVLRLNVKDTLRNQTITDVPVSVYNLVTINYAANPNPFSPNSDGVEDYSLITAKFPCTVDWVMTIKNASQTTIRTFSVSGANLNQSWNGKDNGNAPVADGTYSCFIDAHDPTTNLDAPQVSVDVVLDITPPTVIISHPVPNEIIGGDYEITGIINDTNFAFSTGAGNYSYFGYRDAVNPEDTVWVSLLSPVPSENTIAFWSTGYLTSGFYSLVVNAADNAENTTMVVIPINICKTGDFYSTNNHFSPNNDGVKDTTSIVAVFSQILNWTIEIKDSGNTLTRSFSGSGSMLSQVWDGKNSGGTVVADGTYTYYITGKNPVSGNTVFNNSAEVKVDNTPPIVSITEPLSGGTISDYTDIRGTCTDLNYDGNNSYVCFGQGSSPSEWSTINYIYNAVPIENSLGSWDISRLVNGVYTLRLIGADKAGNTGETEIEVNAYNVRILSCSDSPDPFSPDGDGEKDTTTISADFTMPLDWEIVIRNNENTAIRTFSDSGNPISQVWDGKNEAAEIVGDGMYVYNLTVTDPASGLMGGTGDSITVDKNSPIAVITSPGDNQNVFGSVPIIGTANDGNMLQAIMEYGVGNNPTIWSTIEVRNDPVINDTLTTWNTSTVDNGIYTIRLRVQDSVGHTAMDSVTITIDNIQISDVSISPVSFTPSLPETINILYTIDRNANITLKIYDLDNNLVKTLINSASRLTGVNSETWDGKNDTEEIVPAGGYTFTIEANNGQGWYTSQSIAYSRNWDSIKNFSITKTFNPYKNEMCQVKFTLLENSLFSLGIGQHENGYSAFWPIQNTALSVGPHVFYWDGRDKIGNILDYYTDSFPIVIVYDSMKLPENTIVVNDPMPPVIDVSSDSYAIIVLYGEKTTINYTIPLDGNVTLSIYEPPDTLIKTLVNNQFQTAGTYSLEWDGASSSGKPVSTNTDYIIKIDLVSGDKTITRTGNISVGYIVRKKLDAW